MYSMYVHSNVKIDFIVWSHCGLVERKFEFVFIVN